MNLIIKALGSVYISTMLAKKRGLAASHISIYAALRCSLIRIFYLGLAKCKQTLLLFIFFFYQTNVFAAPYYCLESNQVVKEGDLMEKVQAVCGPPTQINIRNEILSTPLEITEWVYMTNRPIDPTKTSDYLPYLTVVFNSQGKVLKLKQSQLQPPNTEAMATCNLGSIKTGDDMATVQATCGNPTLVNKLQSSEEVSKKMVDWIYKKNTFLAPVEFRFEDGTLKQIKNG